MGEVHGRIDLKVASEFVCRMYGQSKTQDVNEARYNKLIKMNGKVDQENPLANIKRIDCALLPPSSRTLEMKIRRTQYITVLWTRAVTSSPSDSLSPTDYGWSVNENLLKPIWFEGPAIPDSLFTNHSNNRDDTELRDDSDYEEQAETDSDSDGEAWSEDSESEEEDGD
ncbi:uncharacterized protein LOC117101706 [Anneissia japonica]|uniref:uncharacterized protein LOC117101706 n=1 Tax=Anneissia japonica TaxID=1529436 RepID=UPI0014259B20|nr:uncharacterized protein LOC117101706 [Anneissia japonica]